ncbi:type II toxin-antitoxin system VapC family toxin [Scytonema sp. NUACC26]|uniref:type II toxin-antitoxin system VapC family toxin n=1 Tax=Scytonema sp. NUACC26 TaxID=3140176 RepID=UPI0034DC1FCE
MTVVLDASALLAYLQDEPGSEAVEEVLAESVMSSVNWAEVVQKSVAAGVVVNGMREDLEALGLTIAPFSLQEAEMAGRLWLQTKVGWAVFGRSRLFECGNAVECSSSDVRSPVANARVEVGCASNSLIRI